MKSLAISDVLSLLESRAPSATAEKWDNVGLLVGDPRWKTSGAVISIDLSRKVIEAAAARGFNLIITHHPCIFPKQRGLNRVVSNGEHSLSTLILEACARKIAVIACHTNFDVCALEVVDQVTQGLGVRPLGRLLEKGGDSSRSTLLKLSVFVPQSHVESVRSAVCAAGAGQIGNYDSCTFSTEGEGTFRGLDGANPFLGKVGHLERAQEVKMETILPRGLQKRVLKALFESHPYEEVAYDLYPVEQEPVARGLISGLGYGFFGEFSKNLPFSEVARRVKSLFNLGGYWISNPPPKRVRKIAFVAGKGASFLSAAAAAGCDLLITGEAGYHVALEGARQGLSVMELGHRESEKFFPVVMEAWLKDIKLKTLKVNEPSQAITV